MRPRAAAWLILASLATARAQTAPTDSAAWLKQARLACQKKQWEPARQAASQALRLNPKSAEAEWVLGLTAACQGRFEEAERRFARALAIQPLETVVRAYLPLISPQDPGLAAVASILAARGDYRSAILVMEAIRRASPDSYDLSFNLALAYLRSGENEKAARAARSLVVRHPKAEAYNLLGMIEEGAGRHLEAVRAFQKAAELEPGSETYRFDYAFELVRHENYDAATAIFATGVRDFPRSVRLRLGHGAALYLGGKHEDSVRVLLEAVNLDPGLVPAYRILGRAYDTVGQAKGAVFSAFDSYIRRRPNDPWAHYYYASMLYDRARTSSAPDFGPARQALEEAVRLKPDLALAHVLSGSILQEEERFRESVSVLQRAIEADPKLAAAHYRLAIAWNRLGETEKADAEAALTEKLKAEEQTGTDQRTVMQFLIVDPAATKGKPASSGDKP